MGFKVVEKFISINGEGKKAGQLAVFIRFAGCNLSCSYCDTMWANEEHVDYEHMNKEEIYQYIKNTNINNVTITGGEPLLQNNIRDLLEYLSRDKHLYVEVETNGSISLDKFSTLDSPPSFTMDYKLPGSCMEDKMLINNFKYLTKKDTLKFVVGTSKDIERVKVLMEQYELIKKTNIYLSPVYGEIDYEDIVEFMKKNELNNVTLQLQLHKIIWSPEKRSV